MTIAEQRPDTAVTDNNNHNTDLVKWFADYFSQPFEKASLLQKLPAAFETSDWTQITEALPLVGLKSQNTNLALDKISAFVLPCIIVKKDNTPLILIDITSDRKYYDVVSFENSEAKVTRHLAKSLNKNLKSDVMLVTIDADILASRQDQNAKKTPKKNHWFWKPVRKHWSAWFQMFLAALGVNILGLALPLFVMNVYDRVIPNLAFITLWTLAGGVVIAILFDLLLKLIRSNVLERAGQRIDLVIASELFKHAMNIKILERQGGAATIASQIRDFESVRDFFTSSSFVAIIDLLFIGIFVTVLWIIVGPIAIVPLLAVPLVIILALIAQIPIGMSIERNQQLSGKKQLVLVETLLGIETVKTLNGQPVMQQEWDTAVAASSQISRKTKFWSNFAINTTMLIQQSVSILIILWGVYLVSEGQITVGGLIAANILAGRVLAPLGNISQTLVRAQQAMKSMANISDYMKLPAENEATVKNELQVRDGKIQMFEVTMSYPQTQVPALSEFSLSIETGESIGILGRVGSGKTTLGKLFANLIQPERGLILVDGHEIGQYESAALRDQIGYLPQDPEMFTGTILENLLIGRPNATEAEINRALYYSGMDYFASENPEGLKQFIGEKGNRLSGGQRQSISLARLILREPKIIFLDEPTNAMDHMTESIVVSRLKELNEAGTTLVISTHRHSLTAILDRLIVLEKGKKIMDGKRELVLAHLSKSLNKEGAGK